MNSEKPVKADMMAERMRTKLSAALHPSVLSIVNQSALHAGHAGDDGTGETHYHAAIVSDAFKGMSRISRQRLVFDIVAAELAGGVHALSLKIHTPDEYERV